MSIAGPMTRRYDAFMAQATQTRPDAAPAPLRFTRAEYYRMAEAGLFEGRRVELLDGEVIAMTPQGSRHAAAVARINRVLLTALGDQVSLRPQLPLILDERSEPEPDIAVCRRDARDYASEHPGPADTLLVIEVADTSLDYDRRRKARAYATAGIPAFWIVNLPDRCLEWFADPDPASGRFLREERVAESGTVTLPGGATIPVTDLLPPV